MGSILLLWGDSRDSGTVEVLGLSHGLDKSCILRRFRLTGLTLDDMIRVRKKTS